MALAVLCCGAQACVSIVELIVRNAMENDPFMVGATWQEAARTQGCGSEGSRRTGLSGRPPGAYLGHHRGL